MASILVVMSKSNKTDANGGGRYDNSNTNTNEDDLSMAAAVKINKIIKKKGKLS